MDPEEYVNKTNNMRAFLAGLQADATLSPNSTDCALNWMEFYYQDLTTYLIKMHYANMDESVFNTTKMIHFLSLDLMQCTDVIEDSFLYFNDMVS